MRVPAWLLALLGGACCTLACGQSGEDPAQRTTLLVGFLTDESNITSAQGRTAQLLVPLREWNDAGGLELDGVTHQLDLVVEDHGGTPEGVQSALERLAAQGVHFAVGPPWSSLTLGKLDDHSDGAVAKARELGLVLISGSATAEAITDMEDDDYMWRTVASDTIQAHVIADLARRRVEASTASVIYRDDAWGKGLSDAFEREFENLGGETLVKVPYPAEGDDAFDYSEVLARAFLDMPDAVYLVSFSEALNIGNQMVSGGYLDNYPEGEPTILGTDGFYSSDLPNNMPAPVLERLLGTISSSDPDDPDFVEFQRRMTEAGFEENDTDPHRNDALVVGLLAIQAASSDEPDTFKRYLRAVSTDDEGDVVIHYGEWEKAKEALLRGDGINFEGASGPIEFTERGDVSRGTISIWEAQESSGDAFDIVQTDIVPFDMAESRAN